MAAKILVKLLFTSGSMLARSVSMAYRQAILRAEGGFTAGSAEVFAGATSKMSPMEAKKILGLDNADKITIEDILKKHDDLITLNDPKDGGSEYLQSKVLGAKICLETALKEGKLDDTNTTKS
ncbi:hypothetical protein CYY_001652 [Polysphondylium violaceum]|uniref:Uncharacterized protein n=1 Tax=Polysphondylium violaceum TaxID=133409 RepID=A0A8J4Q1F2_9MYCE|nr:hypothetical protein CYY_001652 [Polysphondylium violaceum]